MFVLGSSISVQTSKRNIWNNKYMEGPNKHWGIEKKKLTSGGGGDVYLALKSKHFIHFSIGGYTSVYLQRYRNPLTFLGSVRFFD